MIATIRRDVTLTKTLSTLGLAAAVASLVACSASPPIDESATNEERDTATQVCRNVSCTPGFDGTPLHWRHQPEEADRRHLRRRVLRRLVHARVRRHTLHCVINPKKPTEGMCVGPDPCAGVSCTPGFDGTPLHCVANPRRPSEGMCVDACFGVSCTPGFDGTPLRCAVNPARPTEGVCVPALR
jgi:hypothetical protein